MPEIISTIYEKIITNKEWLFSGIGVSVIYPILKFIYLNKKEKIQKKNNQNIEIRNQKESNNTSIIGSENIIEQKIEITNLHYNNPLTINEFDLYQEHPTIFDLNDQYESLTPFQKIDSNDRFSGIKFKSKCSFFTIIRKNENIFTVAFRCEREKTNRSVIISSAIQIENFPILKALYEDQSCIVAGTVISIQSYYITFILEKIKTLQNNEN